MLIRNSLEITGDIEINKQIYPLQWWLSPVDGAAHRLESGVGLVADIPQPDSHLFNSVKNPDGTWTSTPRDPAVIAAEDAVIAQAVKDAADLAAVKAMTAIQTFVAMTPAQVDTYITNNVTSLATVIVFLKLLTKGVLILARRSLR